MSNFSKIPGPNEEELLCGICAEEEDEETTLPTKKRQRKSHRKFTEENLQKKEKESQETLTNLAFKPCCSKKCLLNIFGKNNDPNLFDFTDEAKKML